MSRARFILCCVGASMAVGTSASAQQAPSRPIEFEDDLEDATSEHLLHGRLSGLAFGVQLGFLPRSWRPSLPGSLDPDIDPDDTSGADEPVISGASAHASRNLWLQMTLPMLRTRRDALFGVESEHTIGFSREKHLDPVRAFTWSTQWAAALSKNRVTGFAGVRFAQQPRYWWMVESRRALHGVFGAHYNLALEESVSEFGYEYRPLLTPLQGNVTIDGLSRGAPTHTEHRVWLDFAPIRLDYVMRRIRFFREDEPARHTHEIVFTLRTQ